MKKYTVKAGEDLGTIASMFGIPSWKYLYQLNKDKIGDNPDLLQEGIVLDMPTWDSTSGDEKIKAKEADPFKYTGGLRYHYPWVPLSLTLVDDEGGIRKDVEKDTPFLVIDESSGVALAEGKLTSADSLEVLIPDAKEINVGIKGHPINLFGRTNMHPDDID